MSFLPQCRACVCNFRDCSVRGTNASQVWSLLWGILAVDRSLDVLERTRARWDLYEGRTQKSYFSWCEREAELLIPKPLLLSSMGHIFYPVSDAWMKDCALPTRAHAGVISISVRIKAGQFCRRFCFCPSLPILLRGEGLRWVRVSEGAACVVRLIG